MPEVIMTLSIGFAHCKQSEVVTVDDDDWNSCESEEDKNQLLNEYWQDWSNDHIDGGAEVIE